MPDVDPYPEHTKQSAVLDKAHLIGEFLDWLDSKDIHLSELREIGPGDDKALDWLSEGPEKLLAEFFDIDLDKIHKEKDAMLAEMRRMNHEERA